MQALIRVVLYGLVIVLYVFIFSFIFSPFFSWIYFIGTMLLIFWFFPDKPKQYKSDDLLDQEN